MKGVIGVFSEQQLKLAEISKALGHPARIAIIEYLLKQKACVCGDIVDELPLAQATVSQHLKELKKVGLISGKVEGVKVCYCINAEVWNQLMPFFKEFVEQATLCINENDCC